MKKIVANRDGDKVKITIYSAGEPMWQKTVSVEDCGDVDKIRELFDKEMLEQEGGDRLDSNEIEELKVQLKEALA